MNTNKIVENIIQSITTKELLPETEIFLTHWLSDDEKTSEDREILKQLALSKAFPFNNGNLFRGCKTLRNKQTQSYSTSIREAATFAGENGYIIAVDTDRACFDTFDLSNYLGFLLNDIVCGIEDNRYSEELLDMFETRSGEDEVFLTTDLEYSVVMKVDSIGESL